MKSKFSKNWDQFLLNLIPSSFAQDPIECSVESSQQNFASLYIEKLPVVFWQQKSFPETPPSEVAQFSNGRFVFSSFSSPLFRAFIVLRVSANCLSHSQIAFSIPEDP